MIFCLFQENQKLVLLKMKCSRVNIKNMRRNYMNNIMLYWGIILLLLYVYKLIINFYIYIIVGDQKILRQFKILQVIMVPLKICHKIIRNLGLLLIIALHAIIHQVNYYLYIILFYYCLFLINYIKMYLSAIQFHNIIFLNKKNL